MICENCKKAGALNAEANRIVFFNGVVSASLTRNLARLHHADCSYKDCTCQHIIGEVVNRKRANDERASADSEA